MTEIQYLNNIEIKIKEENEKKYLSIVKIPKFRLSLFICFIIYILFILSLLYYVYNN